MKTGERHPSILAQQNQDISLLRPGLSLVDTAVWISLCMVRLQDCEVKVDVSGIRRFLGVR